MKGEEPSHPFQLSLFPEPEEEAISEEPTSPGATSPGATPPEPISSEDAPLRPEVAFERRVRGLLSGELESLTLTRNRTRIFSSRPGSRGLVLRLDRAFLDAPDELLAKVVGYVCGTLRGAARKRALAEIRRFFEDHALTDGRRAEKPARRRRRVWLDPQGEVFDLEHVRDEVNSEYFGGELEVAITWGRRPSRRRRKRGVRKRSIRLGSFTAELNLVRIHRALDRAWVPRWVVASVVHHEMLHAALPAVVKDGRRRLHTQEFRRREAEFEDHDRARRWIDRHLDRLLDTR